MRALCTMVPLVLLAAGALQSARATDITAFGMEIAFPRITASYVVLGRHYISPMEACGLSKCSIISNLLFPYGGSAWGNGPAIATNVTGVLARLLVEGKPIDNQEATPEKRIEFSQPLEVQLLSGGTPIQRGSLGTTRSGYFSLYMANGRELNIYLQGSVTPIDGTCSTPAQNVTLPGALLNKFGDVGSTVGAHSFQIRVENCPKGYNRVGYVLQPRGGAIANAPGVLPLGTGSTASGVKLRITDDKGVPATFGTSIKLNAYEKATGGSYAVPMLASYIKTDAKVTLGTVSGAMTVLLDYQ
ncbi:hypothetical protein GQ57_02405 [Burkholderia sp. MSh2]|nr:hypothetical protein GQ57_02405 [Burkholderia sp. MSh2]KFG98613.1 hypothetical protein GQ56_0103650 [Burkholderia paludis]